MPEVFEEFKAAPIAAANLSGGARVTGQTHRPEPRMTSSTIVPPRPRSGRLKIMLILDSLATLVLAPLALFWAMMSAMSTTTTTDMEFANTYVLVNLALPLVMVLCLIGGWIAWGLRQERAGWVIIFLPLIPFFISIAMMANWPAN